MPETSQVSENGDRQIIKDKRRRPSGWRKMTRGGPGRCILTGRPRRRRVMGTAGRPRGRRVITRRPGRMCVLIGWIVWVLVMVLLARVA
ncbi:hypothetical protein B0H12DRAFT_394006 [Mycena haematopus]|nr:hypothetical protein B0H12DRAFT_394006 [Mycena haematopus]